MTDNEITDAWRFSIMTSANIGSVTLSKETIFAIDDIINHQREELDLAKKALIALTEEKMQLKREVEKRDYALDSIIWYNGHGEWLTNLADQLEATDFYASPLDLSEWHTEKHCIWMLLVGMFGDWGTSIRGGWIDKTKECAEYIRKLCKDDDEEGGDTE